MRRIPAARAFLLVSWFAVVAPACGEDDEPEPTPARGTCDLRSLQSTCMELHDPSSIDYANQEEGCGDAGGEWSNDACPSEALIGCCEYTFGNSFRECFYDGTARDPVAFCMTWDDGVWTPAP